MSKARYNTSFDTGRFSHVLGEGWYFESREGLKGPYGERLSARLALVRIVAEHPERRSTNHHRRAA